MKMIVIIIIMIKMMVLIVIINSNNTREKKLFITLYEELKEHSMKLYKLVYCCKVYSLIHI